MKVAIVYNRQSRSVINLFGAPNQEKIGLKTIKRLSDALKKGGHQVIALEGDKDLIERLEEFMPRVVKGERPGMVFNVSYGIQGQARYTHVPSILEMVGIPYVASGPLAHSLALDKVVTKMILRQHGLPTPDFAVLDSPDAPIPDLTYPLIVKPKSEAVSFGLKVVHNEDELREGVATIFNKFKQPVLVEQYIEGREVNVGLIGNNPTEAFPPVELGFGGDGENIYTYEDKTGRSGRTISHACPAPIGEALSEHAVDIAKKAFAAIGCYDCARVDMRMDADGNLYILEINSLPSLGEHGSYTIAAEHAGLDYAALVNRLVEVASARYFGTPTPPVIDRTTGEATTRIAAFVTQRRDVMEQRLREWVGISSRSTDPVGLREAARRLGRTMEDLRLVPVPEFTDERVAWMWETKKGFTDGTLLIGHLDVPSEPGVPTTMFRREPEWLHGDGIGSSRAPLVMLEFALRAIRSSKRLRRFPIGVLYYTDEGRDARYSADIISAAAGRAKRVLVLRPGNPGGYLVAQRRGQRIYRFHAEGESLRPGKATRKPELMRWVWGKLDAFSKLTKAKDRLSVSTVDIQSERLPGLLPHRCTATILMTYPDAKAADTAETAMKQDMEKKAPAWSLELISDRPPMKERRRNLQLARKLESLAADWEIPLKHESSVWPSVAGLVPAKTACLCGIGPVARHLGTPQEAVRRLSLVQRTLILAEFLVQAE